MKIKGRIPRVFRSMLAFALIITAVFCVIQRLPSLIGGSESAALAAAAFTLTDGKYRIESGSEPSQTVSEQPVTTQPLTQPVSLAATAEHKTRDKSNYYDSFADHSGEAKYEVAEKTFGADGTEVGGGYIKNKTGLSLDFNSILNTPLTFQVKKNAATPQVLIYHTHTGESYLDEDVDYFYESYYSRTNNNDFNVVAVGDAITEQLQKHGINTLHDTTIHDSTYNGSYDRSVMTVESDREDNKEIQVVLDIHRDALGTETCKVKPVFEYNGQKGAQIMILAGCDPDNERDFLHWQNNLSFALKIQSTAEKLYPGMTRPISFDYFAYNEYVCDGSLLIEIGTDANSVEEAEYTGRLLADVLAKVLE